MKTWLGLLIFLAVFALYLFTGYNTISPYRDSGDLIASAHTLGIAHPPGYPLYVNAGKIWATILPLGNIGYRINLMSALFSALAMMILFWVLVKDEKNEIASPDDKYRARNDTLIFIITILATGFLTFSSSVWSLSQVSEMYTLNLLIAVLIVYFVIRSDTKISFYLVSFLLGLGMANHQTIILILPGVIIHYWINRKKKMLLSDWLIVILFFMLGLSVYLFLPLRSLKNPTLNWGEPHSLRNIWRIFTRADYGGLRLHPERSYATLNISSALEQIIWYIKNLIQQFSIIGFMLGIVGIIVTFKKKFWWFLSLGFVFSGIAFVLFSNLPVDDITTWPILEPHLVLPNLFFVLFVGFGISSLTSILSHKGRGLINAGIYLLLICGLINVFANHLRQYYRRNDFFAYDYGKNVSRSLPPNSLMFNPDDSTAFILSYLQNCAHQRQDIRTIAYFRTRWGYEQIKRRYPENLPPREINSADELVNVLLNFNRTNYPIYADLPQKFPSGYQYFSQGLVYKLYDGEQPEKVYNRANVLFKNMYIYRERYRISECCPKDFFSRQILSYYSAGHNNLGLGYLHAKDYSMAESEYFAALNIDPKLAESYNNLGILYYSQQKWVQATQYFNESLKYKYDGSVLFNLGLTYKIKGDYANAEKMFYQAGNSYPPALNEIGLFQLSRGETVAAINTWKKLLSKQPHYLPAIYNLGLGYEKAGDFVKAAEFYKMYRSQITDPNEIRELETTIRRLSKYE